ncbi:MAG: ComEC/Rec2 family competence protein, partial [Dolichospermum sp.]
MMQITGIIICLSYILGLLLTAIPWSGVWILFLGVVGAVLFRRIYVNFRKFALKRDRTADKTKPVANNWTNIPHPSVWLIAGMVGLLATFYFNLRLPQPGIKDISRFVTSDKGNFEQSVIVRGLVDSNPRLTRSQKAQFWLVATQLDEVQNNQVSGGNPREVTGRLYVTVPILQSTGLYPGQEIAVTGFLYKPTAALNPG